MASKIYSTPRVREFTSAGAVLNGGKLYFYLAGTTTPATVYTSSAMTTAHAHPVLATTAGLFPAIWLSASVTYDVTCKNSANAVQWTVLNYSDALTAAEVGPALTADWIGQALYPISDAETASGLVDADLTHQYFYGDIRRYGALVDGTTDDTTAVRNALAATPSSGGSVYFPAGTTKVTGAITWPAAATTLRNIRLYGKNSQSVPAGNISIISFSGAGTLFDMRSGTAATTTGQFSIEDITLSGPYSASRIALDAYDAQGARISRVSITGFDIGIRIARYCYYCVFEAVTVSSAVSKGWEVGLLNGTTFDRCRIDAIDTDGAVAGVGIGINIISGGVGANFEGCWFENTRYAVKCKDTSQLVFDHCYWEACINGVYVDQDTSTINQILNFSGCSFYHVHNNSSLVFSNNSDDVYVLIDALCTLQNGGLADTRIINKTGSTPYARIQSIIEVSGAKVDLGYLLPWIYLPAYGATMDFLSITSLDATPSVLNRRNLQTANAGATTITAFDDGVRGQEILVLIGDANTTIDFTGTTLKGNAGVNWTPSSGDFMRCTFDGTNWLCQISDVTV